MGDKRQATSDKRNTKSYKNLLMWQVADELVNLVYALTRKFPKDEIYGLTSQLRRASLSVVLNIVEGYSRNTKGDLRRFLDITLGSLAEVDYLLQLSWRLKYINYDEYSKHEQIREKTGKYIWSYRSKIEI